MAKFGISQSVTRKEDARFLTGRGNYIDDSAPKEALHAVFVRSPVAHARLKGIDTAAAKAAAGVRAVLTAADLAGHVVNRLDFQVLTPATPGTAVRRPSSSAPRPVLAEGKLRFVGEPIAVVIAETREQAEDAAELVELDYEELPAKLDLAPGGEPIHDETPDNMVYDWHFGDKAKVDAVFASAAHTASLPLVDNRIIANSMEPRGCWAAMEAGRLHLSFSGQGVWNMKDALAAKLGMEREDIRVTNPDVGGGFGMKAFPYPEYFAVAHAARSLGQPVRWMASRSESMLTDNGGRGLETLAEAAFDAEYRLIGVRIHTKAEIGAYCSNYSQFIQTELALRVLTGVYDVQDVYFEGQGYFTNTTQMDAYRGAGRPEAIYVMERLMDAAARQLGQDPFEMKRRSFIKASQMPYKTASSEVYDVGDFSHVLSKGMEHADVAGFPARRADSAKRGKLRGIGVSVYIESILGEVTEATKIEFAEDGFVNLYAGIQSNGQGHETVCAQFLSGRAGIPFEKIRYIQGDSDLIAHGGGTGGSRSVTMQGNSINAAADIMVQKFRPLAEEELEAAAADIQFEDGTFSVAGTDRKVDIMALAETARRKGMTDLLVTENLYELPGRSYPNGCHIAEVEVDRETGETRVVKYTITDDFGFLVNPMLAAGQAHGGVAQGIGQAALERVVYDERGQLLTGSFMDYAMPRASDLPMMPFHSEPVPSIRNEVGMKGCGEAGTVGALAAVTNAALDAVWPAGVRHVDMPLTPLSMWERLNAAQVAQAAE